MGSCIGTGEPAAFASFDAPCGLQENRDLGIGIKNFSEPSAPTIGTPYTTTNDQKNVYGKGVDDLDEDELLQVMRHPSFATRKGF